MKIIIVRQTPFQCCFNHRGVPIVQKPARHLEKDPSLHLPISVRLFKLLLHALLSTSGFAGRWPVGRLRSPRTPNKVFPELIFSCCESARYEGIDNPLENTLANSRSHVTCFIFFMLSPVKGRYPMLWNTTLVHQGKYVSRKMSCIEAIPFLTTQDGLRKSKWSGKYTVDNTFRCQNVF